MNKVLIIGLLALLIVPIVLAETYHRESLTTDMVCGKLPGANGWVSLKAAGPGVKVSYYDVVYCGEKTDVDYEWTIKVGEAYMEMAYPLSYFS